MNKKIIFDDEDYAENVDNLLQYQEVNRFGKKSNLFNEDSDDDENEVIQSFDLKQQFEGDKGKKVSGFFIDLILLVFVFDVIIFTPSRIFW